MTAKTPASVWSEKLPPRTNAPGKLSVPLCPPGFPVVPGPPPQLRSLPKVAGQLVQLTELSPQPATHSWTLPIMSNAPHTDDCRVRASWTVQECPPGSQGAMTSSLRSFRGLTGAAEADDDVGE